MVKFAAHNGLDGSSNLPTLKISNLFSFFFIIILIINNNLKLSI